MSCRFSGTSCVLSGFFGMDQWVFLLRSEVLSSPSLAPAWQVTVDLFPPAEAILRLAQRNVPAGGGEYTRPRRGETWLFYEESFGNRILGLEPRAGKAHAVTKELDLPTRSQVFC